MNLTDLPIALRQSAPEADRLRTEHHRFLSKKRFSSEMWMTANSKPKKTKQKTILCTCS